MNAPSLLAIPFHAFTSREGIELNRKTLAYWITTGLFCAIVLGLCVASYLLRPEARRLPSAPSFD